MTDLGLWDVEAVDESNDTEAGNSPFGAALDVAAWRSTRLPSTSR